MSWLYSRALVEEFSAATCSDGARSALSSGSHTPQAFLPSDRMTSFSRPSRFGMTFAPLTDDLGAELLTWFLGAFPARTSASQGRAPESLESAQECGPTWRASLAKFDRDSSSWKTVQLSLLGASELSSVTWPRSGMTADGQCWELPMLGRRTSETGSGLWPTPTCPNGGRSVAHVTDWRSERTAYTDKGKKVQVDLAQAVKRWPTPTVCGNHNRKGASPTSGDGLATAVQRFTTPCSDDTGHRKAKYAQGGTALSTQAGGSLNPTWVEWLMGWPLGWTDLKPLEMDKSHSAPQQRSESLRADSKEAA